MAAFASKAAFVCMNVYSYGKHGCQKMTSKRISMKYLVLIMCLSVGIKVHAADMPAIAKDHCAGCHAVEKKLYAPSFKDIAMKYRGNADIANKLTESINKGGLFGWNCNTGVRMPAKGLNANDKEIKAMVDFIVDLSIEDSSSKKSTTLSYYPM